MDGSRPQPSLDLGMVENMLASATDAVTVYGAAWRVLFANPIASSVFGGPREEPTGRVATRERGEWTTA